MFKLFGRLSILTFTLCAILIFVHRFILPFNAWLFTGLSFVSSYSENTEESPLKTDKIDAYAKNLIASDPQQKANMLTMLINLKEDDLKSQSALYFASLFANDAEVQEHLSLLLEGDASIRLKCEALNILTHSHKVTVYSPDYPNLPAQRYVLAAKYDCE